MISFILDKSEADDRGWHVDTLSMFLSEEEIGYMKIQYIKDFNKYYPNILHYLYKIKGMINNPDSPNFIKELGFSYDAIPHYGLANYLTHKQEKELFNSNDKLKLLIKFLNKSKLKQDFDKFINFNIKPTVGFIIIHPKFQGNKLSVKLYQEAAKIYGRIYASDVQRPEAKSIWNYMLKNNLACNDEDRLYLKV